MPHLSRTYLKETFFSNFDRTLGSLSAGLSLISVLVSVFVVRVQEPKFIVVRDLIIVATFMLMSATLLTKYIRREALVQELQRRLADLERRQIFTERSLLESFRDAHEMVHNYKDAIFRRFYDTTGQHDIYRFSVDEKRVFNHLCSLLTVGVRTSLIRYFHGIGIDIDDDIAVSVKTIVPSSEIADRWNITPEQKAVIHSKAQWLITAFRDPTTFARHNERETGENCYDITGNTAFRIVIDDGEPYYAQNDLSSLGAAYKNENPNWSKYYNATLMVPIRFRNTSRGIDKCYGILAVDSLNPERRDLYNATCVPILCHAADLLATFFLLLELRGNSPPLQARPQRRSAAVHPVAPQPPRWASPRARRL